MSPLKYARIDKFLLSLTYFGLALQGAYSIRLYRNYQSLNTGYNKKRWALKTLEKEQGLESKKS
ncbi:uncharacterized protein LY89DRAFT_729665 [Mollisia scopiformis]|uniref:Uncharacterized protein n=1 Tax=Mollisia scopiformis TaxID=149040 RepID=A0A194XQ68_MOLSC|nr:uncharacterized protein LY89DRAFT_729665 [Mollisia scopiformis]KUJ22199.1 hypothetical protein LY89DRAFT_729665 [Mollisia scopiformis]